MIEEATRSLGGERRLTVQEAANDLSRLRTAEFMFPRSIAIESPTTAELATALKCLARLPVEFSLAYDSTHQMFVLSTGSRTSTTHPLLFAKETVGEIVELLYRRQRSGPSIHLHPVVDNWVKNTPSIGDWIALSASDAPQNPRNSLLFTTHGITRYSFPRDYDFRGAGQRLAKQKFAYAGRLKTLEIKHSKTPENQQRVEEEQIAFAQKFGGTIEVVPWEDMEKVSQILADFLISFLPYFRR